MGRGQVACLAAAAAPAAAEPAAASTSSATQEASTERRRVRWCLSICWQRSKLHRRL